RRPKRNLCHPSILIYSPFLGTQQSSSSDSSGISSPERMAGATSNIQKTEQRGLHPAVSLSHNLSYDHINRILREAHFSSLQTRGQQGST
uniref:Si:dkey-21c1.1 n=1 Tax=Cyprinus carpio TaxID=7962 RepID=A0A8C1XDN6_CYPCA